LLAQSKATPPAPLVARKSGNRPAKAAVAHPGNKAYYKRMLTEMGTHVDG
jgi:hypothetical protein